MSFPYPVRAADSFGRTELTPLALPLHVARAGEASLGLERGSERIEDTDVYLRSVEWRSRPSRDPRKVRKSKRWKVDIVDRGKNDSR